MLDYFLSVSPLKLCQQKIVLISWLFSVLLGGVVASWLVGSSLERVVRVRALAGDIVLLGKTLNSHSASLHPVV